MRQIILIAHNIRSTHNVGSLLRTAEGLGVDHVYFSGYTPYPASEHDDRLPHIAAKLDQQISKTALGADKTVSWSVALSIEDLMKQLQNDGITVAALEQNSKSISLPEFKPPTKIAIILGREVEGIEPTIIDQCDKILEIPMFGKKESFNVVQAAAIAMYHCRFAD